MERTPGRDAPVPTPWGKRWVRALDILFGFFAATFFLGKLLALHCLRLDPASDARTLSSWLIAWSPCGEYVRRGLPGEGLWWLNRLGLPPQDVIFPLCVIGFAAVAGWFAAAVLKRGFNWWILPASFCLGGLFMQKDDFCFFLSVMAMVWAHARIRAPFPRFLAVNLLGVLAVNMHEVSFFVAVPLLVLLLWSEGNGLREKLLRASSMAPTVLAFALAAVFRGDARLSGKMAASWTAVLKDGYWDGVAILEGTSYVAQEASGLWEWTCTNLFRERALGLPNVFWLAFLGGCIFLAASNALTLYRERKGDGRTLPTLLLFQALCLAPVFPFFFDYSRLFALWILSSYWFWLQVGEERLRTVFPFRIGIGNWDTPIRRLLLVAILCCVGMSGVHLDLKNCLSQSVAGHLVRTCILVPRQAGGDMDRFIRLYSRHDSVRPPAPPPAEAR